MSYPLLRARQNYLNAEVRKGHGFPAFEQMTIIYSGYVAEGNYWTGGEGDRICVKCSNTPGANLAAQPAFCATSYSGVDVGNPSVSEF